MRALLALLLCLTIAFQAIAGAHAFAMPCPMALGKQDVTVQVSVLTDDCCNDAETAAKTGKLCKTGQACNLSFSFAVTSVHAPTQAPASSCFVTGAMLTMPSVGHSGIWRPPTFS